MSNKDDFAGPVTQAPTPSQGSDGNALLVSRIYDGIAEKYDEFMSKGNYTAPDWIMSKLRGLSKSTPRIIDLACGNGLVGKLVEQCHLPTSSLVGYDISTQMVHAAKLSGRYTNTYQLDLQYGLPRVGVSEADLVTAFGLFEFIENEEILLTDIARGLVPGGVLLCSFETINGLANRDKVLMPYHGETLNRFRRSESYVRALLKAMEFEVIEIQKRVGYRSPTTGEEVEYLYVIAARKADDLA